MPNVHFAQPYRENAMGSYGDASRMLIRQHQFPDQVYDERDSHEAANSDRINQRHYQVCLGRYPPHICEFEKWVRFACDKDVLDLVETLLRANNSIMWTGYRVLGTVHPWNGPIWTFELFAKHPESKTIVTDGTPTNRDSEQKPRCTYW